VRGFQEWEVVGWVEKPAYDPATHRLVWSLLSKRKGEPDTVEKGVNYNTYALGREGYFSLNLLTLSTRVDIDKSAPHELWLRSPMTPENATTTSMPPPTALPLTVSPL